MSNFYLISRYFTIANITDSVKCRFWQYYIIQKNNANIKQKAL